MADIEEELFTAGSAPDLKSLKAMAGRAVELQRTVNEIEAMLKEHKRELHDLTTRVLPDTMAEVGLEDFTTSGGDKIEVKDFVSGTLPKDERREAAIAYLEEVGAADIIKHRFQADLGRGEHNAAGEIRNQLQELGVSYSEKEDVHPQTLAAFARERLRNGEEVHLELLGLYAGRAAKVKLGSE